MTILPFSISIKNNVSQEITINQSNHIQELNNPTKVASPFDNIVIIVETYKT
jgi:hypothetical protein